MSNFVAPTNLGLFPSDKSPGAWGEPAIFNPRTNKNERVVPSPLYQQDENEVQDGIGFLQSYLRGRQNYSQIGTDIPGRQYETEYAQEQGGPLVSEQVISSLPPAMTQDEFRQEVWNRQDRKRPEVPTSPRLKDMIKNFWDRYGYMRV
jgi:hypothetical protein